MDEMIVEVDEKDCVIGLRPKKDFYTGKFIHRSSHLILFNSKNEILIQKRSHSKKWYPRFYEYSVTGTVGDESYEGCIIREIKEELGISIPVTKLFVYYSSDKFDKSFRTVFLGKSDLEVKPDKSEIEEVRWVGVEDLKMDLLKNPDKYTPPFIEGMKIFFSEHH